MNKLIIFVKNPELGKVKTRIAKTMGDEAALQVYKELLTHTKDICLAVNAEINIYYSSSIPENDLWAETGFNKKVQEGNLLGERISAAFKNELTVNSNVIIIGSDCGALNADLVNLAFKKLEKFDVVLGPTFDGGYYLLGMKEYIPSLFQNVPWSTTQVYPLTLVETLKLGKSFFELTMLSDIDHEEDYLLWKNK